MPRRKSITTRPVRADHWDPHETALIRSLTTEDEEFIDDGLADIDERGQAKIHAGRKKRLTLQRGILSWTLTDVQNHPLPLSEQSIKELAPEDSQYLFAQITALSSPMTEAEKKASTTPATPGTEAAPQ